MSAIIMAASVAKINILTSEHFETYAKMHDLKQKFIQQYLLIVP